MSGTEIEILWKLLQDTEFDFSVCSVKRFSDGEMTCAEEVLQDYSEANTHIISNTEYIRMQFDRQTEFGVWNKLFRRELFEQIQFAEGKIHEDVIFSADMLQCMRKNIVCTDAQLYYYRQRNGSIVSENSKKSSADRVFAGEYLLKAVKTVCPEYSERAYKYAIEYSWMFVDAIYVNRTFRDNQLFLKALQKYLRKYIEEYKENRIFSEIQRKRMELFAKSGFLYGFNAYSRLIRVYLYRILGKDAYKDGHGI